MEIRLFWQIGVLSGFTRGRIFCPLSTSVSFGSVQTRALAGKSRPVKRVTPFCAILSMDKKEIQRLIYKRLFSAIALFIPRKRSAVGDYVIDYWVEFIKFAEE
jgi:hypothetical protein